MEGVEKYLHKGFEVLRGREVFRALEKEGEYVFHGTARELIMLEPRQPFNKNKETGKMAPHGDPAVCATPYSDVAIFRSIVNRDFAPVNHGSRFWADKDDKEGLKMNYEITKDVEEQIKEKTNEIIGKVYFFRKEEFEQFSSIEYRSATNVEPLGVVLVTPEDLPSYEYYKTD
jgi:hypothetical protein